MMSRHFIITLTTPLSARRRVGGALKISNFITCLYRTVLEVNHLFHAESAQNYLLKKILAPPPWKLNGPPPKGEGKRGKGGYTSSLNTSMGTSSHPD